MRATAWMVWVLLAAVPGRAQVEKVAIRTTGISCGICAGLSEIYFHRVPGVDHVKISLSQEAILLTYKPGAVFDPKAIRDVLAPLQVGVVQFQISARGKVHKEDGKPMLVAGKDKFLVLTGPNSLAAPFDTPVHLEGVLLDRARPMEVRILAVTPLR